MLSSPFQALSKRRKWKCMVVPRHWCWTPSATSSVTLIENGKLAEGTADRRDSWGDHINERIFYLPAISLQDKLKEATMINLSYSSRTITKRKRYELFDSTIFRAVGTTHYRGFQHLTNLLRAEFAKDSIIAAVKVTKDWLLFSYLCFIYRYGNEFFDIVVWGL